MDNKQEDQKDKSRFQKAFDYYNKGLAVKQIAQVMQISPSTVQTYILWGKEPKKYQKKIERRRVRRRIDKLKKRGIVYVKDVKQNLKKS